MHSTDGESSPLFLRLAATARLWAAGASTDTHAFCHSRPEQSVVSVLLLSLGYGPDRQEGPGPAVRAEPGREAPGPPAAVQAE
jgi:hypothetical protein